MIVPMTKATVVILESHRQEALKKLRGAGLLHIRKESLSSPQTDRDMAAERDLLEQVQPLLPRVSSGEKEVNRVAAGEAAREVLALAEKIETLREETSLCKKEIEFWTGWGDFEPADLEILRVKGIGISLLDLPLKEGEALAGDPRFESVILRRSKKQLRFAAIHPPGTEIPQSIPLPAYSIAEQRKILASLKEQEKTLGEELAEKARSAGNLIQTTAAFLSQEIEFEEIKSGMEGEGGLVWFTGFLPRKDEKILQDLASRQAWGLLLREPSVEEPVPTLLENKPSVNIIRPVFAMMGIAPGYREFDISSWFLILLSVFTAMILGDGGYGMVIVLLCLGVRLRLGRSPDVLKLFLVFGLTTVAWGAITGNWFSSPALVRDTPLRYLVLPPLAVYQSELFPDYPGLRLGIFPGEILNSGDTVMWVSLLFGGVLLCYARIRNFLRKWPSPASLAQLGWLSIVAGVYWVVMQLVMQLEPLEFIKNLILPAVFGGFVMVILFEGQQKGQSFFAGVGKGLAGFLPTALNAISSFGNIISFIRLFAVGLAGAVLAQSFNSMAPQGGPLALVMAALILTAGHSLNIVLSALSVLVHGVRLNVLEISGQLDMEWAGFVFEPFQLRVPEAESPYIEKE